MVAEDNLSLGSDAGRAVVALCISIGANQDLLGTVIRILELRKDKKERKKTKGKQILTDTAAGEEEDAMAEKEEEALQSQQGIDWEEENYSA